MKDELRRLAERGIEPERDLWPDLRREIEARPQSARPRRWWVAAAGIVLLALVAGVAWRMSQPAADPVFAEFERQRSFSDLPADSSPALQSKFAEYLAARGEILRRVGRQLQGYPPETRDEIRRSVETIERAMRDIERTMASPERADETRLAELYDLELRLLGLVHQRLRTSAAGGTRL